MVRRASSVVMMPSSRTSSSSGEDKGGTCSQRPKNPDARQVHGLTEEMVEGGKAIGHQESSRTTLKIVARLEWEVGGSHLWSLGCLGESMG